MVNIIYGNENTRKIVKTVLSHSKSKYKASQKKLIYLPHNNRHPGTGDLHLFRLTAYFGVSRFSTVFLR